MFCLISVAPIDKCMSASDRNKQQWGSRRKW